MDKFSFKVGFAYGLAAAVAVWYVQVMIEERAKRKAIDEWKNQMLAELEAERKEKGL